MKITAVTKFKHGVLFNALKQLNWTQADLARATGIGATIISNICNLKERPSIFNANRIQNALGENGVYIDVTEAWPETFKGFKGTLTIEQTQEVELLKIEAEQEFSRRLNFNGTNELEHERLNLFEKCFNSLEDREKKVIELRWLSENPKTLEQVGGEMGYTRERIRQISIRGLSKLNYRLNHEQKFEN